MQQKINKEMTILWFTSDISDFSYSNSNWVISLSDFAQVNNFKKRKNYNVSSLKGGMSLKIKNLSFQYEKSTSLIKNWNVDMNSARSIGLAGKNGIGKTTLAQLFTGLLEPTNGSISLLVNNQNPTIAMLDQFPERILGPNSLDSFIQKLIKKEKLNKRLVNKCINQLNSHQINWEIIKTQSALDIPWSTLRMSLIIILSHCNYDLLILDEPTFGFGWEQKEILSQLLCEVLVQKHVILISHDIPFFIAHCDQIYDLDNQSLINNKNIQTNVDKTKNY
ncbi:MAG: ATP-binding cassette domain-containing protein [Candidatus Marinimicrobia bacterium]|nr:ATP-binding cassette domain-containing protein [Candidatus Neomarinimicrobiota bacterium]